MQELLWQVVSSFSIIIKILSMITSKLFVSYKILVISLKDLFAVANTYLILFITYIKEMCINVLYDRVLFNFLGTGTLHGM